MTEGIGLGHGIGTIGRPGAGGSSDTSRWPENLLRRIAAGEARTEHDETFVTLLVGPLGGAARVSSTGHPMGRARERPTLPGPQVGASRRGFSATVALHRNAFCLHARARSSPYPAIPLDSQSCVPRKRGSRAPISHPGHAAMKSFSLQCTGALPPRDSNESNEPRRRTPRGWHLPPNHGLLQTHRLADSRSTPDCTERRASGEAREHVETWSRIRPEARAEVRLATCPPRVGTRLTPRTELRSRFRAARPRR